MLAHSVYFLPVIRGEDGRIARVRYVLPRRWVTIWAANWVGPGRGAEGYPAGRERRRRALTV
jgi:hypothetical protein